METANLLRWCGLIGLVLLVCIPTDSRRQSSTSTVIRCEPSTKLYCDAGKCEPALKGVFLLLEERGTRRTYSRCDLKGCDSYDAQMSVSGGYENWQMTEPKGVFFKRSLDTGEFVESATLGLQVFLSFGSCAQNTRRQP